MLKAVIFDFDGIIVDTEIEWYNIYKDWLKDNYNYNLLLKDYVVCVGSNSKKLFEFIHQVLGDDIPIESFEKQAMNEFILRTSSLPPMPGVGELMKNAKDMGLKIAIATSATKQKPYTHLKRLGLLEYVDAFSTAELIENIKPAPDIYLKACELLECKANECIAIEDSENGLLSAKRAGIPCVVVPNDVTRQGEFSGALTIIKSLEDLQLNEIADNFIKGSV